MFSEARNNLITGGTFSVHMHGLTALGVYCIKEKAVTNLSLVP